MDNANDETERIDTSDNGMLRVAIGTQTPPSRITGDSIYEDETMPIAPPANCGEGQPEQELEFPEGTPDYDAFGFFQAFGAIRVGIDFFLATNVNIEDMMDRHRLSLLRIKTRRGEINLTYNADVRKFVIRNSVLTMKDATNLPALPRFLFKHGAYIMTGRQSKLTDINIIKQAINDAINNPEVPGIIVDNLRIKPRIMDREGLSIAHVNRIRLRLRGGVLPGNYHGVIVVGDRYVPESFFNRLTDEELAAEEANRFNSVIEQYISKFAMANRVKMEKEIHDKSIAFYSEMRKLKLKGRDMNNNISKEINSDLADIKRSEYFDKINFTHGCTIEITTKDIKLKDLVQIPDEYTEELTSMPLGKYMIKIGITTSRVTVWKAVNYSGIQHPHVNSGGKMCLGNLRNIFEVAVANLDLFEIYNICISLLTSYNHLDPYERLHMFQGVDIDENEFEYRCEDCGDRFNEWDYYDEKDTNPDYDENYSGIDGLISHKYVIRQYRTCPECGVDDDNYEEILEYVND